MLSMMLSRAASGLLRALIQRIGEEPDKVLLSEFKTVGWQSLTFVGERHLLGLRVPGPDAMALVARFIDGIEEAEFSIPGQILADIAVVGTPVRELDGSINLAIEALTVAE